MHPPSCVVGYCLRFRSLPQTGYRLRKCGILSASMSESKVKSLPERRYSTAELVRRLLGVAWQFRGDCLLSLLLSLALLLLGLGGLQLLGVIIDVIRHAL